MKEFKRIILNPLIDIITSGKLLSILKLLNI